MREIFTFLNDLFENNSKEWMDENRAYYRASRDKWLEHVKEILNRLSKYDPTYEKLEPKKTIFRINNNRLFHPERPIYKDNFAFNPTSKEDPSFYLHVSPFGSFVGGGYYRPSKDLLKNLRDAIDYNGDKFIEIINKESFRKTFGTLDLDERMLKTTPRGYDKNHKYIHLLRRKSFTAIRQIKTNEILSSHFHDIVENAFKEMIDFRAYLKEAADFEV